MMLPINNAYVKIMKMKKQGIEINCEVDVNEIPKHETKSDCDSSKANTEQAYCLNQDIADPLYNIYMHSVELSESLPSIKTIEEAEAKSEGEAEAEQEAEKIEPQIEIISESSESVSEEVEEDEEDIEEKRQLKK